MSPASHLSRAEPRLAALDRHLGRHRASPRPHPTTRPAGATAGDSGVRLVVGTNNFGARLANVDDALSTLAGRGLLELDVARAYNNGDTETAIGAALPRSSAAFTVATKTHFNVLGPGASRVKEDMAKSLAALQLDRVDIYYIHSPYPRTTLRQPHQVGKSLLSGILIVPGK